MWMKDAPIFSHSLDQLATSRKWKCWAMYWTRPFDQNSCDETWLPISYLYLMHPRWKCSIISRVRFNRLSLRDPKIYFGHATTQNLNANEIQTITTLVPPIHEFPVIHIHTLTTPRAEVQAITVSPPTGDATIDSAYSFALSLDTIKTSASLHFSGLISADVNGSQSLIAGMVDLR